MTPKQKYDERKRLRIENDLAEEQRRQGLAIRDDQADKAMFQFFADISRVANALEYFVEKDADK